jgi:hemerythrin
MTDMAPFELEWMESLEIGVPEIDRDHKGLIDDANAITRALVDGRERDVIVDFVARMERDCVAHFHREEGILRRDKFADLETHAAEHRRIEGEIDEIKNILQTIEGPESLIRELALSFRTILIDHLLRYDLKYKSHLMYRRGR